MSKEAPRAPYPRPTEVFGLTEHEQVFGQITDARLKSMLQDEQTIIHTIQEDRNNYGEFLFITMSREQHGQRIGLTCFGLGKHEAREAWLTDRWYWYNATPLLPSTLEQSLNVETAIRRIDERAASIQPSLTSALPSDRATLFAVIADLTDEDAALSELEDLEAFAGERRDADETEPSIRKARPPEPAPNDLETSREDAIYLSDLKEAILTGWQELPPEHQATMVLLLLHKVAQTEYRHWLLDAIEHRYLGHLPDEAVGS